MADGDGEVRWDGLCSRDASARDGALENIKQLVLKKSEAMALDKGGASPPAAERLLPSAISAPGELNQMLARLLTLSKRCPFRDVREKTEAILKHVQDMSSGNSLNVTLISFLNIKRRNPFPLPIEEHMKLDYQNKNTEVSRNEVACNELTTENEEFEKGNIQRNEMSTIVQ